MSKLLYFKNVRQDGGVRTGIEVDEVRVFHRFDKGKLPSDPAIDWYVDVVLQSPEIPTEGEAAKKWLLSKKVLVKKSLLELADRLHAGTDEEAIPFILSTTPPSENVKITIKGSAIRRVRAHQIATQLRSLEKHWEREVQQMQPDFEKHYGK